MQHFSVDRNNICKAKIICTGYNFFLFIHSSHKGKWSGNIFTAVSKLYANSENTFNIRNNKANAKRERMDRVCMEAYVGKKLRQVTDLGVLVMVTA